MGLAIAMHDAARALNARVAAGSGCGPRWRLRIGIARGSVVTGGLGEGRRRCCFFGGALAEAARLSHVCPAGSTLVSRGLARAECARAFAFAQPPAACGGDLAGLVVLAGRRRAAFGIAGGSGSSTDSGRGGG